LSEFWAWASVWHHQGVDGFAPFSDAQAEQLRTEMALHVLAYNIKRIVNLIGAKALLRAITA